MSRRPQGLTHSLPSPSLTLLVAVAAALTCTDATAPDTIAVVTVKGPSVLYVGDSARFAATSLDARGDTLAGAPVTWVSDAPAIATVDQRGMAKGISVGEVTIRASVARAAGTGTVAVRLVPVARVSVTPARDSLFTGTTLQLQVGLVDSLGRPLIGRQVTWSSSDTTKGVVSDSGLVTARAPGSFAVTAASEGVIGGAFLNTQQRVVTLLLPDSFHLGLRHKVRFIADLRSASGIHLSGRPVTWSSSDPTVAVIDTAGIVTPRALGTSVIRAASTGLSDSTALRVVPEPVLLLTTAGQNVVNMGTTDTVIAYPIDSGGMDAVGNPVGWRSGDTTVFRVAASPATDRKAAITPVQPGTATLTATCGGKTSRMSLTVFLPATRFRFELDSLMLRVGDSQWFPGALWDTLGGFHDQVFIIHYTSSDPAIAYADTSGFPAIVRALRAGQVRLIGRAGNWADTATIVVEPAATGVLRWTAPTQLVNYDSGQIQLFVDTTSGSPDVPPRSVVITSSDTATLTASPTSFTLTGQTPIKLTTRRPNAVTLTARTGSSFTSLFLIVPAVAPRSVVVSPRPTILRVGDTIALGATVKGTDYVARRYPVVWSTSDGGKATVSSAGQLIAQGAGAVVVSAASGSARDTLPIEIQSAAALRIDSTTPHILTPGVTALVAGAGFAAEPGGNTVTVDGTPVPVTAASASALTITLPPSTAFRCRPTHEGLVVVTSGQTVAADSAPLAVADDLALAQGAAIQLGDSTQHCLAFSDVGAWYRVVVTNASSVPLADYEFGGESAPAGPASTPARAATGSGAPGAPGPLLDSLTRVAGVHRGVLEANRTQAIRFGAPGPLLFAARRAGLPLRSPSTMINGVASIRIPRVDVPDFCANYTGIQARLVYSGTHSRIYEDVTAPLAGTMDSVFAAVGREFDTKDYPELLLDFGDPLGLDSLLDGSGKVTMLFSPVVNGYGLDGFVTSCDFYPESVAPSSNTTEIFYGPVPTRAGTGFGANTADYWRWFIRSAVMHESKHIASYATHLGHGAPFEEVWLEEASAVVAEELWSRSFYGSTWKGHTTYLRSLYCDVRPTTCPGHPYSMFNAFAFFFDYGQHHQHRTPLGPSSAADASFYGSGWALLRWAIDEYAGSESAFLHALTQETALTGAANLAARTGHPVPEMLSDWFMAWTLQDLGPVPNQPTKLSFPSWNLPDIFAGMNHDFPLDFVAPFPVSPRLMSAYGSAFADSVYDVPPGGSEYYQLDNYSPTPLVMHLKSLAGTPVPAGVRLQLLRIR